MTTKLLRFCLPLLIGLSLTLALFAIWPAGTASLTKAAQLIPPLSPQLDPSPPAQPVKLIFIHHSVGEHWLTDDNGGLGLALQNANYFVSDTNYEWGPDDQETGDRKIGDHTDIQDWYRWFTGPHRETYLAALYAESDQHASYSRLADDPGGLNTIIMFKSCFPNSNLEGNPDDPPAASADNTSDLTVAKAKRIYLDLLRYFADHQEKLFVVITAPPFAQSSGDGDDANAPNARAFNNWLVNDWLTGYAYANVAVFDFYTVLTSNGGDVNTNDLYATTGNHHRYRNSVIEHITNQGSNFSEYRTGDSHPSQAGNLKATGEFVPLLNIFYHRWQSAGLAPDLSTSTMQPSTGHVQAGDRVTYTIALRNTGMISVSTLLTNVVPSGLTYIPGTLQANAGAASDSSAPALHWNGWVLTTSPVTITYAVTVTADISQAIISTATIAPTGYETLTRTATVIVNGYQVYVPLIAKN